MSGLEARVRAGGLLEPGRPVLLLLSGGRDSACLLDLAVTISGRVRALHVNYGLRPEAETDGDQACCVALCERLGVELAVERPGAPTGNVQAWARELRYAAAARLARGDDVATGHTATDQVETVLYRLAASPGRRALLGMRLRVGALVRPLLIVTREETAAHCTARGLAWREDASNAAPAYARSRVRHGLVPALKAVHPAAEANVLRTLALLREEAEVLDAVVDDALRAAGSRGGRVAVDALAGLPPALRRLAFQRLAGEGAPSVGARVDEVIALGRRGGTRALDLGDGLRAVVVYGELRFEPEPGGAEPADPLAALDLTVPGSVAWGTGTVTCELGPAEPVASGVLDAAACPGPLVVRAWRPGDRMRPLGLGGSRSLQDLFTDRKVPRDRRGDVPVVVCDGEIAWVADVATAERFKVTGSTRRALRLTWRR